MATQQRPTTLRKLSFFARKRPAYLAAAVVALIGGIFIWRSFAAVEPSQADLDGNGVVNLTDLSLLLANYGKTGAGLKGDVNGDNAVNLSDLSLLLTQYGKTVSTTPAPTPPTPPSNPPTPPTNPPTTPPTPTPGTGSGTSRMVHITFYGSWDNDPPGALTICCGVIHGQNAGGTGTYADPLTFASPEGDGEYETGQIIYVPSVRKYFIREDICAVSWTAEDGCGDVDMVDLYVGNPSSAEAVVECQNSLTKDDDVDSEIIVDPDPNRLVDPGLIWNQSTGECMTLFE